MIKTKFGLVKATGTAVVLMADYSCITKTLVMAFGEEEIKKAFEAGCHKGKTIIKKEASDGTDNGV